MALYGGIQLPNRPDPENIRHLDLFRIPMIRRMMRYGMRIDPDYFYDLSASFQSEMTQLRKDIVSVIPSDDLERFLELADLAPSNDDSEDAVPVDPDAVEDDVVEPSRLAVDFNLDSSEKMATLLYDVLGLHLTKGVKIKKTKGGERLSTGKKTLEQLKREHPVVPLILRYRECSKLDGTYAKRMPQRAILHPKGPNCPQCGRRHYTDELRVHSRISTTRTASGRTASSDPNLANIPTRTKDGQKIRAGFIASEGHVIVQRDWAQIELRLGADRSRDSNMLRIYQNDGDIHVDTAMRAFDKTYEEVNTPEGKLHYRAPCKNVNFAVFYLISAVGLLDLMAVTYATAGVPLPTYMNELWCENFITRWFHLYPGVRLYLDDEESKCRRYGINWTRFGRVRRVPEVRSFHGRVQDAGVRQSCNHGIQGYSADLMCLAMGEAHDRLRQLEYDYHIPSYPLMTIYDELLIESPEDTAETIQATLSDVMDNVLVDRNTGVLMCAVPIKSDGKIMDRWEK